MVASGVALLAGVDSAVPRQCKGATLQKDHPSSGSLFLFLKTHGLIGLGPTLEASFNLNYLPKVPSPNTIVRLSSHPLNTSKRGLNFNMSFGGDIQAIASIIKYMIRTPDVNCGN